MSRIVDNDKSWHDISVNNLQKVPHLSHLSPPKPQRMRHSDGNVNHYATSYISTICLSYIFEFQQKKESGFVYVAHAKLTT